jgi:peptide deformylase
MIEEVVPHLIDTLNSTSGVGLAGPQVGFNYRVFITKYDSPYNKGFEGVCINPEIIEHSEDLILSDEGCLSIPGINESVQRYSWVKLRYYDRQGELKEEIFQGLLSRIVQHEFDHLNGITLIDKLPKVRLRKLRHKITDIVARLDIKVTYDYK